MDKEFSKGFVEGVQDIVKFCAEEKTNNCDLTIEYDCGKKAQYAYRIFYDT